MSTPTETPAWRALHNHRQTMAQASIAQLFDADPQRFSRFSLRLDGLLLDYSKNLVNAETMRLLAALARERGLGEHMQALFNGGKINLTENRAVLHTALRGEEPVLVDGVDVIPQIAAVLDRMQVFSDGVRTGTINGHGGRRYTDVVHIGIGGSHLGPQLATLALSPYAAGGPKVHFVSNIDMAAVQRTLARLEPATTLVIVVSKTFTTSETLANARTVRDWLTAALGAAAAAGQFVAVTANAQRAAEFGIAAERTFPFWDWVGGRYSLWSAVGLPIALAIGMLRFREMLAGAHAMDEHFRNAAFEKNMPVVLALLGIWYNNFFGAASYAVLPYDESLALLPAFLQQLDMESCGKSVHADGTPVDCDTGMIIWGAAGTDAQHSFFQLLHQGTRLVPADFIAACQPHHTVEQHHAILMANFFAQTAALMNGAPDAANPHERFSGNRPSNSLLLDRLTPRSFGQLLALYEHKVFVQSVVWGINAFDQPGVELGKKLAARILPDLDDNAPATGYDASTNGLIDFYKANRGAQFGEGGPQ
jgi:glucose-6-phosphate isomerase